MKTLWLLVRRTVQEFGEDNCSHMAAAISYYVLFSIIPLTLFLVSIFGFVVRDTKMQEDIAAQIVDFLNIEAGDVIIEPNESAIRAQFGEAGLAEIEMALSVENLPQEEALALATALEQEQTVTVAGRVLAPDQVLARNDNVVTNALRGVSNAGVGAPLTLLGLLGMAWSASAMFGAIRKSLNIAWDTEVHRPVVQQKLVDLGMVAGLGLLLGLSVAGTAALRTLQTLSDDALGPLSTGSGFFWSVVPLFLPAIFSFTVFMLAYRYVPNAPTSFRTVWPGALLATVLFELLKNGFAIYIANFSNYAGTYGALGGILLFMTWLYLTATILLVGAEVASEYPRVLRGDYAAAEAQPAVKRPVEETVRRTVRGLFVQHKDEPDDGETPGDAKA